MLSLAAAGSKLSMWSRWGFAASKEQKTGKKAADCSRRRTADSTRLFQHKGKMTFLLRS